MPRKSDLSKKNNAGYYHSIYNTTREYNKNNYDVLTVRIPKGMKESLKEYQQQIHKKDPNNPKYTSVNSLINDLLKQEFHSNKRLNS